MFGLDSLLIVSDKELYSEATRVDAIDTAMKKGGAHTTSIAINEVFFNFRIL